MARIASEDATGSSVSSVVTSLATIPTAGNDVLVCCIGVNIGGGAPTFTVSDNRSNTYNAQTGTRATLNDTAVEWFRATNVSTGDPFTITVSFGATITGAGIAYVEYSNLDQSAGIESSTATVASGTSLAAGSVNPGTGVTALYIACCSHELAPQAMSVDSPFTQFLGGGAGDGRSTHDVIGALEAENPNCTWSSATGALHSVLVIDEIVATANPKGPLGMPLHGPLGGPV